MGRLLSIDYGKKRCGVAVTDPLQIVAGGLATVPTQTLETFLKEYFSREDVEAIIIGLPRTVRGEASESMRFITPAVNRFKKVFPDKRIEFYDERFTSVLAHRAMIDGGLSKMQRRDKALVDEMSAVIILNDYLQSKQYRQ